MRKSPVRTNQGSFLLFDDFGKSEAACAGADQISAVASPSSPCRKPRQPRRERSARLKSSPGRDQRAQRGGIARNPAQHLAEVDVAVRLDGALGQRRKRPAGGIGDHPQRRERQAGLGGIGCGDMTFHIDRCRARSPNAARPCRRSPQSPVPRRQGRRGPRAGDAARRGRSFPRSAPNLPENGYRRPEPRSPPPRRPISATDPARRRRRTR